MRIFKKEDFSHKTNGRFRGLRDDEKLALTLAANKIFANEKLILKLVQAFEKKLEQQEGGKDLQRLKAAIRYLENVLVELI